MTLENDKGVEKIRIASERAYLYSPSIHVGMKAEISGAFTDKQFIEAVQKTCIRHPLLNSTIKIDNNRQAYYKLNSSKEIEVSFFEYTNPDQWIGWFETSDNKPFDFENGPLLKVAVFRNNKNSIVVLLGHHILGDGFAYFYLIKDLVTFLNGKSNNMVLYPSIINDKTSLPSSAKLTQLSHLIIQKLNLSWRKNNRVFTYDDYNTLFSEFRDKNPPGLYLNILSKEETEIFVSRCRDMHISVNEAILTAFLYAIQKCDKKYIEKQLEISVAINVRKELVPPVGECMGNFASGILVKMAYDNRKSFYENAEMARRVLNKKIRNFHSRFAALNFGLALDPDFIDSIWFAQYGNYDNGSSKKLAHIVGERANDMGLGITNLGRMDSGLENRIYCMTDLVFIQPAMTAREITVGVITFNGRMNFCIRYFKNEKDSAFIEEIFTEAIKKMREC